jgi:hypothetical protein
MVHPLVERAQRAYGSYLGANGAAQAPLLLAEARSAYQDLVDAARNRNADAMYELARVLKEPDTVATMQLKPAEILEALPETWGPSVLADSPLSTPDLLAIGLRCSGETASLAFDRVLYQADRDDDVGALTTVADQGNSRQRNHALSLLGNRLYVQGRVHLLKTGIDPQEWVRQSADFLSATAEWIEAARSNGLEGSQWMHQLHELSDQVERRTTHEEAQWILYGLNRSFLAPVADLRRWDSDVEHLCRRGEELLIRTGTSLGAC